MIEWGNGLQSVLPNDIYGLRVSEGLTISVGEVGQDDEAPPRAAPGKAVYAFLPEGMETSATQEPADLLCSPEATLASAGAMS